MAKLDIKRVKEYMDELGYERDEAIKLVQAEMEEETKAKKDFDDKTKKEDNTEDKGLTKEDILQIMAEEKAKENTITETQKEETVDILKRLI